MMKLMLDRLGIGKLWAAGLVVGLSACPGGGVPNPESDGSSGGAESSTSEGTTSSVTTLGNDSIADDGSTSLDASTSSSVTATTDGLTDGTTSGDTTSGDTTSDDTTEATSSDSSGGTTSGGCDNEMGGMGGGGECVGPPPMMMCDNPSPYGGDGLCDPYAQDCPPGDKCMPWANDGGGSWNSTTCTPLAGNPGQVGDVCTVEGSGVSGVDDCDLGLMCWNVDPETNVGSCIELCSCGPQEPTCQFGGTTCLIANDGVLPLCTETCDPLGSDCQDGEVCVSVPDSLLGLPSDYFSCVLDSSFGAQPGDPCDFLNVCPPGSLCLEAALVPNCVGTGCCTEYCDLDNGDEDCSDPASTCTGIFADSCAPEACLNDVGYCG